jgi:disulfide bond formation protein DsbB
MGTQPALKNPLLAMPRWRSDRLLALVALTALGLLGFGLYLQHGLGLEPCPMCIVQRYALMLVALIAAAGALTHRRWAHVMAAGWLFVGAALGAAVAARQSWLQWYPPEVATCGRDFYATIENFPLRRAIPMIFKGSGDCTKVDWTFLGGSIANWSFLCFVAFMLASLFVLARCRKA